jgi:hypothetical protein
LPSSPAVVANEQVLGFATVLQVEVMSVTLLLKSDVLEDCHVMVGAGVPVAVATNVIVAPTAV